MKRHLPTDHPRWTDEEKQLLRDLYPTVPMTQLVARFKRSAAAIYVRAQVLGLGGTRRPQHPNQFPQEFLDQVRALHAEGHTDSAIGRRMKQFQHKSDPHRSVTMIRKKLGLPVNRHSVHEAGRRAIESQRKTLGIRHGGDLRALSYRRYAGECGWPEDLPPRAVQILNVLAEHGPQTKLDLARLIGMPTNKIGSNGSLKLLTGSSHSNLMRGHGTYTGLLMSRGLILQQHRSVGAGNGKKQGLGRLPSVFILTPAAIDLREKNLERQRDGRIERANQAGLHANEARRGSGVDPGPGGPGGVGGEDEAGRTGVDRRK